MKSAMDRSYQFVGLFFAVASLAVSMNVNGAQPWGRFDTPRGGEMYEVGQSRQIKLAMKRQFKKITIELSRDGGQTFALLGTIDNMVKNRALRNTLTWLVALPPSAGCILRATMTLPRSLSRSFLSSMFSITSGMADGAFGIAGPAGPQGEKGDNGDQGSGGALGPIGPQGIPGAQGEKGVSGDTGSMGTSGPEGPNGLAGPVGLKGPSGAAGPQGPTGQKGDSAGVHLVRGHFKMTSNAWNHYETINDSSISTDSVIILTLVDPDCDNGGMVLTHRVPTVGAVSVHVYDASRHDIETGSFDYLIVNP